MRIHHLKDGRIIVVANSGRRVHVSRRTCLAWLACTGGTILAVLAVLTFYSPFLHKYQGDWTGSTLLDFEKNVKKFAQDNIAAAVNVIAADVPRAQSPIPTIRLLIKPQDYWELNRLILLYGYGNMPKKPRIKAVREMPDGSLLPVQVSVRGTNAWHHQMWKPSLRIRHKKSSLSEGYRNHVLIGPEDPTGLRNWLSNRLAATWGMLTLDEHFVRLMINNRYVGLYTRVYRFDESLLIHHNLLPGPFFRLESGTGPVFQRAKATFDQPETWEVKGATQEEANECLRVLDEALSGSADAETFAMIDAVLDDDAFAKWLSVRSHSAETHINNIRHKNRHNVAFWLDTTSGKLVALLFDVRGYGWYKRRVDYPILSPTLGEMERAWLRDPRNLALFVDRLYELLATFGSAEAAEALVREMWGTVRPDAMSDLNTSEKGEWSDVNIRSFWPVTALDSDVETTCDFIHRRVELLLEELADTRVALVDRTDTDFEVLVTGLAGVMGRRVDGKPFRVYPNPLDAVDEQVLLPSLSSREDRKVYAFYRLEGQPSQYAFTHRLTDTPVTISAAVEDVAALREQAGVNACWLLTKSPEEIVLGPGEVIIPETRVFDVGQPVTIAAGTRLLLAPEASLLVRGKLDVAGTEQQPVVVRPLDPERPFGVIAVVGARSKGSRLRWMDCLGGSIDRRYNLLFTGMVSVHDCPDIRIEHCVFGKNHVGDDAVHIARAGAVMRDSVFENARSDAVDWDQVDGTVQRCVFRHSGNDGIDLSMGRVTLRECRFVGCGDKGLSVGEGSEATVTNANLTDNVIGVAVKDRSVANISDSRFDTNETALAAYCKKWRWEVGGSAVVRDTAFVGSKSADVMGDKKSQVRLIDCTPARMTVSGKLRIETSF